MSGRSDRTQARAAPELAVLSAIAHPDVAVAEAALAALDVVSEDDQKLYSDVILAGLPASTRQVLEARMIKGYEYQSDFARKYYSQGRGDGVRRAIVALVATWLPRFRGDLASHLRDRSEAELMQIFAKLARARDKDAMRAVLDRMLDRRS